MTFFKKYMVLVVGGGIAAVILIIVAILMIKFSGEYGRVQGDLQANLSRLDRLHQRVPFPSSENVERVTANLAEIEDYLDNLIAELSAQQVEGEEMERAAFPAEIERTARRLRERAAQNDVVIGDAVAFGFQRYAAGNLPMQEHVHRLVVQLRSIEALCSQLFANRIAELISVEREVFDVERTQEDVGMAAPTRRPGRPGDVVAVPVTPVQARGVEGLYTKERFTITFLASDQALRDTLNSMSASPMLMVVRNLELRNEMGLGGVSAAARLASRLQPRDQARPGLAPAPGAAAQQPTQSLRHEDRVVAGLERVRVTMEVDVYRFEKGAEEDPS